MGGRLLNPGEEQARALLLRAAQHFVSIAKTLKSVVDDASRPKPQLILNWAELTSHGARTLKETLAAHYKKLYYFVQLLKLYI